jgi:hypothetical protein
VACSVSVGKYHRFSSDRYLSMSKEIRNMAYKRYLVSTVAKHPTPTGAVVSQITFHSSLRPQIKYWYARA